MNSNIERQSFIERSVEEAFFSLIEGGVRREALLAHYPLIRRILHAPFGTILSEPTYRSYVVQIEQRGVQESVPFRRLLSYLFWKTKTIHSYKRVV
jgi:hypothetical protein